MSIFSKDALPVHIRRSLPSQKQRNPLHKHPNFLLVPHKGIKIQTLGLKIFEGEGKKKPKASTLSTGGGFLNDKGHALNLFLVVKSQAANISIWVSLSALMDFIEDLRGITAPKHGQLPQCPIPPIIVSWNSAMLSTNTPHLPQKLNKNIKLYRLT